MMRRFVVLLVGLLVSCTAPVETGLTGVRLLVTYEVELDQLRVEATTDDVPLDAFMRPDPARTLSTDGEDLVVLFDEAQAGRTYAAQVLGLRAGVEVAAGAGSIALVSGEIVVLAIHLGAPASCGDGVVTPGFEACDDGDADDGDGCSSTCRGEPGWQCTGAGPGSCVELCGDAACAPGQRCDATTCVCDTSSCPDGCCEGDACRPGDAASACGAGGNACESCTGPCVEGVCAGECDAVICPDGCCSGATCNPMSVESCGVGGERCNPCVMGSADNCVDGECRCGADTACAAGQRCSAGLCICDETSCPSGCCDGVECRVRSLDLCGVAGSTCVTCDRDTSDNCAAAGTCQCGSGPACPGGQECASGVCRCTAASCASGCCEGDVCREIGLSACGTPGGACATCDPSTADACLGGACRCGAGAGCGAGQRCDRGACVCDGLSCPGCCDGSTCRSGDDDAQCGSGGSSCESCGGAGCSAAGACAGCNATTCASGCCTGPTCNPSSAGSCGTSGAACVACDPARADGCTAGGCTCGGSAACGAGQRCVGGSCVCDATSCPTGCCTGTTCTPLSVGACGAPGATCAACTATLANGCSAGGACMCGSNPSCAPGQRCSGGMCVCDATSCPSGCCSGQTCASLGTGSCAPPGMMCAACSTTTSDRCTSGGVCSCGTSGPCAPGQRCVGGSCVCDSTSCAGCCDGTTCAPGTSTARCGVGGAACVGCAGGMCTSGVCGNACGASSCGTGCCSGSSCVSPPTPDQCGIGGDPCSPCGLRADQCSATGACRCDGGPPCLDGQQCISGPIAGDACQCTPLSCPESCCLGDRCQTRTATTCGTNGEHCVDCTIDGRGDRCSGAGRCSCGGGPLCLPGMTCRNMTCQVVVVDPG